jgi:predicted DNA-binding protein
MTNGDELRFTLRLSEHMRKRIDEEVKKIGVTRNSFIKEILWQYFERKDVKDGDKK